MEKEIAGETSEERADSNEDTQGHADDLDNLFGEAEDKEGHINPFIPKEIKRRRADPVPTTRMRQKVTLGPGPTVESTPSSSKASSSTAPPMESTTTSGGATTS